MKMAESEKIVLVRHIIYFDETVQLESQFLQSCGILFDNFRPKFEGNCSSASGGPGLACSAGSPQVWSSRKLSVAHGPSSLPATASGRCVWPTAGGQPPARRQAAIRGRPPPVSVGSRSAAFGRLAAAAAAAAA